MISEKLSLPAVPKCERPLVGAAYLHALLIDPKQEVVISDSLVLVKEGCILYAGPYDPILATEAAKENFATHDCSGQTVLPSLVDAHVHLSSCVNSPSDPGRAVRAQGLLNDIALAHKNGISHLRDCCDWDNFILNSSPSLRREQGAKIAACGKPITTPSGHLNHLGIIATSKPELECAVDRLAGENVDFIKICASGGFMTPGTDPSKAQYSSIQLSQVVERAARFSKKVAAHAHSAESVKNCAEAGVQSIEHATFLGPNRSVLCDEAVLEQMAAKNLYFVATIGEPTQTLPRIAPDSEWANKGIHAYVKARKNVFRRAIENGVKFVLASDAWGEGNAFGLFHRTLRSAIVYHGLSLFEALKATTVTAREVPGLQNKFVDQEAGTASEKDKTSRTLRPGAIREGPLAEGEAADLVFLEGNPLEDLESLGKIKTLLVDGQLVS